MHCAKIENAQENEYLVLQLNQNNMISSVQDTSRFTQEDLYQLLESIDRDNFVNTSDYYIFTEKIETTDWKLSLIYPKRQINKNSFESISSVLILIFVFGIGMFCINLVIVKEVTNPINRVTKDIIQTVETGKLMPVSFTPMIVKEFKKSSILEMRCIYKCFKCKSIHIFYIIL